MKIAFNKNNYPQFSNFHPCKIEFDGNTWETVENIFQSRKTLDKEEQLSFLNIKPNIAKRKGRQVKMRPDWEAVKKDVMYEACLAKFTQNDSLRELLLSTGDALIVEDTSYWHDNIWGCCTCARCRVANTSKNLLGVTLMRVRAALGGTSVGSFTFSGKRFEIDFAGKEYDELNSTVQGRNTLAIVYRLGE